MEITYRVPTRSFYSSSIDESITDYEEQCVVISDDEVVEELAKILIDRQDKELTPQERNVAIEIVRDIINEENLRPKLEEYYRDELKEIFMEREEYAR
jgi:hypothetical protein